MRALDIVTINTRFVCVLHLPAKTHSRMRVICAILVMSIVQNGVFGWFSSSSSSSSIGGSGSYSSQSSSSNGNGGFVSQSSSSQNGGPVITTTVYSTQDSCGKPVVKEERTVYPNGGSYCFSSN